MLDVKTYISIIGFFAGLGGFFLAVGLFILSFAFRCSNYYLKAYLTTLGKGNAESKIERKKQKRSTDRKDTKFYDVY
jgi:hypothetical protein